MSRRRYIVVESAISMAINAVLSVAFAMLAFGRYGTVDLGARGTLLDTVPQSFMVALMAALIPSLIARRRTAAGRLPLGEARPVRLAIAAPLTGVIAAGFGTALYALVVPDTIVSLPLFVAGKALYGAALGGIITALALRRLLADGASA